MNDFDPYTLAAHFGGAESTARPIAPPIYQSSTFWSPDADEFFAMATQPRHAGFYTRYGNPTVRQFEEAVAGLEGAEAALGFASGMAATTAAIMSLTGQGGHVVGQTALYAGVNGFLRNIAPRFGIEVAFFAQGDLDAFARALKPQTRLVVLESPSNPLLGVSDIARLAAQTKAVSQAVVLIDNTIATPINQRPLSLGVDLVMHSATKSLGGHADLVGGVLAGSEALIETIWQTAHLLGGTLDPFAAWLALRGVRTLAMRVERHNRTAQVLAERLERHPKIAAVHYPGLRSHPQHALAAAQMSPGFGGLMSFEVDGGLAAAQTVLANLRVAHRSASFGSFSSLAVHPAAMWAGTMTESQMREIALPPGLIRFGVGFEDPDVIAGDIEQALAAL
ncbi:MAG TPA: aminotransferase class I/II-fold pyridoxal phosphate-dependent enzyme [Caulobacteraceae bacterium]|nr:aminotransferase class I/II-fold pyridoxal phosphate-dependent enzyme [Caulobacteraceae bacterium]